MIWAITRVRTAASCCLVAVALAGCGARGADRRPVTVAAAPGGWRALATPADRTRLRDWRTAWVEALRMARAAGYDAVIAREGVLLVPDAALPGPALPDGFYACRVTKLGSRAAGGLNYVAYPAFDCRVLREDGLQHIVKLSGSQRPVGHVYPDGDRRNIFLGTLMLSDERMAMDYGQDLNRDLAGIVERVGDRRWRLVLPYPRFESLIDVVELVPRQASSRTQSSSR